MAAGLLGLLAADGASAHAADEPSEYQVKAAFLLNFVRFVEWPPEAFRTAKDPLLLCIFGQDPFDGALQAIVQGKTVNGRSLAIRQISDSAAVRSCHVAFFTAKAHRAKSDVSVVVGNQNVLIVGESDGFVEHGGMINFVVLDSHVRFEINPAAAARAGLTISSKLLQIAILAADKGPGK